MAKFIDLTGQTFNRWTVVKKNEELSGKGQGTFWWCKCSCGNPNLISVSAGSLKSGKSKSCGCWKKERDRMPKGNVIDMIGQKFGHLTVLERAGSDARGEAKWLCECDCELHSKIVVLGSNLRKGHTQSCGCERRSHGEIKITKLLLDNNVPFETEKIMFKYSNGASAKFDFYVDNKYLIEYDGETHYFANLHGWHTEERLEQQLERDEIKNTWCKENNIPLIRIPYTRYDDLCIEDLLLETSSFIVNK